MANIVSENEMFFSQFESKMKKADSIMSRYKNTLRELAK